MSLTKKVYLTISGYDIKLSDNLTFYQKDQLKLIFYINEYGIDYENNATARALMPVNPLNAILFIENPDGVDSVSSAKIEDNAVTFYLDSTHTQYVGISRMQLRLFDQDGCAITLPHFTFEIRENIYGSGDVRFQNVVMVDQTGTVILTEDNDLLDVGDVLTMGTEVAYPQVTKTIKELPVKNNLDGTEKLIVEDNEATKQAPLGTIVDEIKQNSQEKIREIESELAQTNAQLSEIKTFKTFPSDEILDELPINSTFEVKGFYEIGDMPKCLYKKTWPGGNSINKTGYSIKPITDNPSEVFLPSLGIRTGSEYAVNNSEILSKTYLDFGSTLVLPSGDYYFDRPIDLASKQLSLTGKAVSFTTDLNTKGLTWLYFMNLNDGECAINIDTGSISNVIIKGNARQYDYVIDRTKTYVDKSNIEQENYTVKCYGIKGGICTTSLNNVYVANFYYGCYLDTGNIYITDFYARHCHIGLSIGNDIKCKGIYGWDLHTMLQIRGSISSAVQVRCDSCHHLVHLVGYMSGNILTDLDADYCLGSVIKIGNYDEWGRVENLVINGVTGRHCCLNVYDITNDISPTTSNIVSDADVSEWAFISVERKNDLNGALITVAHSLRANPLDSVSNYRTPEILLASGKQTSVVASFNTTFKNQYKYESYGEIDFDRQTMLNSIINFSEAAHNTRIALITPTGNYYYHKSDPVTITTTKTIQEELT